LPEFRHLHSLGLIHNKTGRGVLNHRIVICVGLAALCVAGATPAQTQAVYVEPPRGYVEPPPEAEPLEAEPPMVRRMFQPRLAPSEVLMIVRASGLRPLTQPAVRGWHYVLLASDNMGGQLRVRVNGNNGRIMHAAPAHDPRFAYHPVRPRGLVPVPPPQEAEAPPTYVPPPPNLRDPSAPPPSARIARTTPAPQTPSAKGASNHGLAGAPDTAGAMPARPARTPLPRPRPASATQQATAPAPAAQVETTPAPQPAPRETSPEAEQPAAPAPGDPTAAPAQPAPETQMVPVAPLE
jgi:hypothetical protein